MTAPQCSNFSDFCSVFCIPLLSNSKSARETEASVCHPEMMDVRSKERTVQPEMRDGNLYLQSESGKHRSRICLDVIPKLSYLPISRHDGGKLFEFELKRRPEIRETPKASQARWISIFSGFAQDVHPDVPGSSGLASYNFHLFNHV